MFFLIFPEEKNKARKLKRGGEERGGRGSVFSDFELCKINPTYMNIYQTAGINKNERRGQKSAL